MSGAYQPLDFVDIELLVDHFLCALAVLVDQHLLPRLLLLQKQYAVLQGADLVLDVAQLLLL